jgi:hypothetical protein
MSVHRSGRPPKLSPDAVREIRAWYSAVQALPSGNEMARKHRINTTTLYAAARGINHKRVV